MSRGETLEAHTHSGAGDKDFPEAHIIPLTH